LTGTPFALALAAVPAAGGLAAQVLAARRAAGATATEGPDDVPLEWAGIVRPFTAEEVATMDRVLGLERRPEPTPSLAGAPSGVSAPARPAAGAGRRPRPPPPPPPSRCATSSCASAATWPSTASASPPARARSPG